jgi:cell division protein FtsW
MHRNAIYLLLLIVMGLVTLGVVMLFSTSAFALESHGDMYFFVKRQAMWLGVAVVAGTLAAGIDYQWWKKLWWVFFAASVVLLILCYIPPIGMRINGSHRWINIGVGVFQPSELAKLGAIFFVAWWFEKYASQSHTLLKGFVYPMAIVCILLALIAPQQDLGYTALIGATVITMMFVAGMRLRWLAPFAIIGVCGIIYLATHIDERRDRLLAFMNPEKYEQSDGYQQLQGLIAIGSGGIEGRGLGEGRQKRLYLPYAHTDFIFPMIGEELGLRFTLLTVIGYLLLCLCGTLVAANARDRFGMLLGFGCVVIITLQSIVNIGVTTSLLPNKGMPLPFISFGGSNLVICFFMLGILVNIHRHGNPLVGAAPERFARIHSHTRSRL